MTAQLPRRRFHGDLEAISHYLDSSTNDINRLFHGLTLLHWGCSWSDVTLVQLLLSRGADTEVIALPTGKTPLMYAIASQRAKELVALLINHSASLEARDPKGCTALMHMCAHGKGGNAQWREASLAVLEQLMAAGADFRAQDEDGWTALRFAWPKLCNCAGEDGRVAERLIAARGDVDERCGQFGRTLLLHATQAYCHGGEKSPGCRLVRFCIDEGAQVDLDVVGTDGKHIGHLLLSLCEQTKEDFAAGVPMADLVQSLCSTHWEMFHMLVSAMPANPSRPLLDFKPSTLPSKPTPSTLPLPGGFEIGETVWATATLCSMDEAKTETLLHMGAPGIVLAVADRDASRLKVQFQQSADGSGKLSLTVLPSAVSRSEPPPRGGLRVGDSCWAVRDLHIEANQLATSTATDRNARGVQRSRRVPALTRGTVIGLSTALPNGVAVQFDGISFGKSPAALRAVANQLRATNCIAETSASHDVADVCASRTAAEAMLAACRGKEHERAERVERQQRERRQAEEQERRREEEKHAELIRKAKQEARRKVEEESAAAKAKAKVEAEAREAAKRAAEASARSDEDLGPAVYKATTDGNTKGLRQLLRRVDGLASKKRRAVQRWSSDAGETPLYAAALQGRADAAALLLDAHFSIDHQLNAASVGFEGATPLYAACEMGNAAVAQLLLQRGADPSRQVSLDGTPTSYAEVARQKGHARVVDLLHRHAAEVAKVAAAAASVAAAASRPPDAEQPTSSATNATSSKRFLPALNAITEDGDEEEAEGEEESDAEETEEDLADIDEGWSPSSTLSDWLRQLEDASTADTLREAISAIERTARAKGVTADALAPLLPQARDRLDTLQVESATSLHALGCALPPDVISAGMLSTRASSSAFVSGHTILVVDGSGSMRNADVIDADGQRVTRASAVLGLLTQNFLRTQIDAGVVSSERVSLIKVQGTAAMHLLPFALFPLDPNVAERIADSLGEPRGVGPYLPALGLLAKLVELSAPYLLPRAKTNILFLSDGRPSDRVNERELPERLRAALAKVHAAFAETQSFLEGFQLLGFGEADEGILRMMARMVPGNVTTFSVGSGAASYRALEQSVSTFSSSVAVSRLSSVSHIGGGGRSRTLRVVNASAHQQFARYRCVQYTLSVDPSRSRLRPLDLFSPLRSLLLRPPRRLRLESLLPPQRVRRLPPP